jgi:beta-RFAP synthase
MVSRPALRLAIHSSSTFETSGPQHERVTQFAQRVFHALGIGAPHCRIDVEQVLPAHTGLGSGTQLALAVAAGLHAFLGRPTPPAVRLSAMVGRAARSSIGTYGFERGGLLLEGGHQREGEFAPLLARVALPDLWRFALVRPQHAAGLSGAQEHGAFCALPPVAREVSERLYRLATEEVIPAAEGARFEEFSRSLHEYSVLAGSCFAAVQGGPFNGPQLSALVDTMRDLGASGVGQSSWGPTLFAVFPTEEAADQFATRLQSATPEELAITIAPPNNTGARIACLSATGK